MKTAKSMSKSIFRNTCLQIRVISLVFSLITASGYASEHTNFANLKEIIKSTDSTSSIPENSKFTKKFNSLVSRAYFKLIVEAERADIRLGKEYQRLYAKNNEKMDDLVVQEEFTLVYRRFLTHRRMLSGLKSWRIFSENRTGDLEYFKNEYRKAVYAMYLQKSSDDKMVAFLMYRLADLYHLPQ